MNFLLQNWKTSGFALASLAVYVASYFLPQHKAFLEGIIPILLAGGLITAKDWNVTGSGNK